MQAGTLDVHFYPQGILAEKIRAGGMGLAGIVTDVGMDSLNLDEKQLVELNGKNYMLEPALTADIAIVNAYKADEVGNLIFDKSARNTNPIVAMAGDWTIAGGRRNCGAGAPRSRRNRDARRICESNRAIKRSELDMGMGDIDLRHRIAKRAKTRN